MDRYCRGKAIGAANCLTLLRIALLPLFVWRSTRGDTRGALAVYCVMMATDALDGWVARRLNQVSDLGKLLDPLADKLTMLTVLVLFVRMSEIPLWVLALMLIKEMILVIGSAVMLQQGIVVSAMTAGKAATACFVLSTIARFCAVRAAADWLLYASLALSLWAFIRYCAVQIPVLFSHKAVSTK